MTERAVRLEEPLTAPVFLLSCERSGSTLLRYLLDTHSWICSPGELMLGSLCSDLKRVLSRTLGQMAPAADDEVSGEMLAIRETRRILAGIMNAYARAKGKVLWCDKTPWNLQYLDSLRNIFPDARYICLYRNCMDVVHSCLETARSGIMDELAGFVANNPGNVTAAMIDAWLDRTGRMVAFASQNPDACIAMKFESLVDCPEESLRSLFEFLEVPWEPGIIERALLVHHDQGGGDWKVNFTRKIDPRAVGKGARVPLAEISAQQLQRVNELLEVLGYPSLGAACNGNPSPRCKEIAAETVLQPAGKIREFFQKVVPERLRAGQDVLISTKATVQFVITGVDPSCWTIRLEGTNSSVIEGSGVADCTIVTKDSVILGIANESLNAAAAYADGDIQVLGPMDLAQKVGFIM